MKNKMKWLFPLLALLLLAPWPIAYAHDYTNGNTGQDAVQIEIAPPAVMPHWQVFGRAIGGVETPGDLFYVDASEQSSNMEVTLYLTNTNQLVHCYSYLILEVGIYVEDNDNGWTEATCCDGSPVPVTFITIRNGQVSFTLPGCARYKVTINGGSFSCFTTQAESGSVSPQFHLTADQA